MQPGIWKSFASDLSPALSEREGEVLRAHYI